MTLEPATDQFPTLGPAESFLVAGMGRMAAAIEADGSGLMPPIDRPPQPAVMTDTTQPAAEAQASALRQLSPLARLELAIDMSTTARALLRARLREAHPEWPKRELERAILRYTFPDVTLPPSVP